MSLALVLLLEAAISLKCVGDPPLGTAVAREDRTPRDYAVDGSAIGTRDWGELGIKAGTPIPIYAITTRELVAIKDPSGGGACLFINRSAFDLKCTCEVGAPGPSQVSESHPATISGSRQSGIEICLPQNLKCPK